MNTKQRIKEDSLSDDEKKSRDNKLKEKRRKAGRKKAEVERKRQKDKRQKELAKRKKQNKFIEEYNGALLFLKTKGILPLGPVIDKTGDEKRYKDFVAECKNNNTQDKYLYLVKIKSNIDDRKFVKIGVTSNENLNKHPLNIKISN